MKTIPRLVMIILVVSGLFFLLAPDTVFGYPVDPLPEDNLIVNPWFRSASEPGMAGSDGWVVPTVDGVGWGLSQKDLNPSPDIVISGTCGFKEIYCGTGMRWAHELSGGDTSAYPGVDVYMYQVVQTSPANRKLKFFMHWVIHRIDIFEVNIYGSNTPDGPWTPLWQVVSISQNQNPPPGSAPGRQGVPWFTTDILDTVLGDGYPFYKVELHARYPEGDTLQGDVGVKVTGIYFSTEFTEEAEKLSTPAVILNPTIMPSPGGPDVPATATPEQIVQANTDVPEAPTNIPVATGISQDAPATTTPTIMPTERVRNTDQPTAVVEPEQGNNSLGVGFAVGLLTASLVLGVFLVIRSMAQRNRNA